MIPFSLDAAVIPKQAISGSANFFDQTQEFVLNYEARYENPATVAHLEGRWHDTQGPGKQEWSVTSTGILTGTRTTGCTYRGQFSERPERKAIMDVLIVEDCGGATENLTGLATLRPDGSLSIVVTTAGDLSAVALSWSRKN